MAGGATFELHGRMLVDKRAQGLRMAFRANCVLIRARLEEFVLEGAMGIMAVAANQQALIHLVVKGLGEGGLNVGVAAIAEIRFGNLQRMFTLKRVAAMATDAAHARFAMSRSIEVGVRPQVTTEALFIDLFGGRLGEAKYLGHVATRLHMGLRWTVAALASNSFAAVHQCQLRMRIRGEVL